MRLTETLLNIADEEHGILGRDWTDHSDRTKEGDRVVLVHGQGVGVGERVEVHRQGSTEGQQRGQHANGELMHNVQPAQMIQQNAIPEE